MAQHQAWVASMVGQASPPSVALTTRHTRPPLTNEYVAPRHVIEQTIADIWQAFLGLDKVGIYDQFLALGGSSLRLTEIQQKVQEAFQVDVSLQTLMENQTVAELALAIMPRTLGNEAESILAHVERLSDEDAATLLRNLPT
jgi:acyl carrier protein